MYPSNSLGALFLSKLTFFFLILVSTDSKSSINDSDSRLSDQRWTDTITARYQCDEGECSVQSCLNQFTACELMTGNNRVGCDNCTKMVNGEGGKTVYTNATKQLLISSPPAILILHLKRFQVRILKDFVVILQIVKNLFLDCSEMFSS